MTAATTENILTQDDTSASSSVTEPTSTDTLSDTNSDMTGDLLGTTVASVLMTVNTTGTTLNALETPINEIGHTDLFSSTEIAKLTGNESDVDSNWTATNQNEVHLSETENISSTSETINSPVLILHADKPQWTQIEPSNSILGET